MPSNRRRVLYVENGIGYGGATICLRHLVRNLDRARYEPMVVTGRTGPEYEGIADEAHWKHIPDRRIDVIRMREWHATIQRRIPGLHALLGQLIARLDDVGNFLPFFTQLLWQAWRFKPDLIHANNEALCNRAALLVAKMLRIPAVCHVRSNLTRTPMMQWAYGLPNHFIAVSNWVSDEVGKLGVPEEKRTVVYDGIRLEDLDLNANGSEFRRRHNIERDAFVVGLVGLLIPWKGQDLLLDTAKTLVEQIPRLKLILVGGTPEECEPFEASLRERVRQQSLQETVVFTGHETDMPTVYNGLDVVVSASTKPEPLGTMVIECMAMARPLVAPAHGGAAEMTRDGREALHFEPSSADGLASAILRLHSEPELRVTLAHAARERALATFAVSTHVSRVQEIYERIVHAPQPVTTTE